MMRTAPVTAAQGLPRVLEEREVITLILGLCAVIFFGVGWRKLQLIPRFGLLLASFASLLAGSVFTIVEIYGAGQVMNVLEHGSYALSSALLAWWCAVVALSREARRREREERLLLRLQEADARARASRGSGHG